MATCHGCSQSFGFLNKEVGCPNCGFSYCKKCLRCKLTKDEAQKLGKLSTKPGIVKGISICRECYSLIDKTSINTARSPQFKDAVTLVRNLQRLESMDDPFKPPITLYRDVPPSRLNQLKTGLSEADQKIVERLEELRRSDKSRRKSDQPDDDVEARLSRLRGEDPDVKSKSSKDVILKQKPETEADLMSRLGNQVKLDQEYDESLVGDIEERLARLNPIPADSTGSKETKNKRAVLGAGSDEELSEQEQVQKLINKFVAEVALEAKLGHGKREEDEQSMDTEGGEGADSDENESDEEDDEDDDFCQLCNENRATLKCESCSDEIFCKKCFHEFHVEIGELHTPTKIPLG